MAVVGVWRSVWRRHSTLPLRQYYLRLQFLQFRVQLTEFRIRLFDYVRDVRQRLSIGGHFAQLFRTFFDFKLFADLAADVLLQLLQFERQGCLGQRLRLQPVLVTELVQHGVPDVIPLRHNTTMCLVHFREKLHFTILL